MSFAAGSVWKAKIAFDDGRGERSKYLIILTECVNVDDVMWMACTTSQGEKRYPSCLVRGSSPCGCPKESCFRIEAGQEPCFPVTTWVQFDNTAAMTQSDLVGHQKVGKIGFVQALDPGRLRAILNCAKKSKDVRKVHLASVERTLKALNPVKGTPKSTAPAVVHGGILLAAQIDRYCGNCRASFQELVGVDLAPLKAAQEPNENFLEDVRTGIEMIKHCGACSPPNV